MIYLDNLLLRMRIAVLWILWAVAWIGGILLISSLRPSILEAILSGEAEILGLGIKIGSEASIILTVIMLIPLIMAFLTVTLNDNATRWGNIVIGIVSLAGGVFGLISQVAEFEAFLGLTWISMIVISVLIIGYAYKVHKT